MTQGGFASASRHIAQRLTEWDRRHLPAHGGRCRVGRMKTLACAAFALVAITAHAGDVGRIRICHYPGLTELGDSKSFVIPAGSGFTNSALPDASSPDHTIETTATVTLGPKPACVTVAAVETGNFIHKPITAKSGQFIAAFNAPGLTPLAVAIEDFHPVIASK